MSDQENKSNPFQILGDGPQGQPIMDVDKSKELNAQIEGLIASDKIFLFMKGTPQAPMCGFSANVISLLNHYGVAYKTFDILSDMEIRQGVKEYANWPTFPQLYINKELVGGNDIVMELYENKELEGLLKNA